METRYGIFVTMTKGYLYSLNATMNALNNNGTNCNFEIAYADIGSKKFLQYIELSKTEFKNPPIWTHVDTLKSKYKMNWFTYKYQRALDVWDKYDVICFIDGDLFFYTNLNEYFDRCKNENKMILNSNPKYDGGKRLWKLGEYNFCEWSKPWWYYTDCPLYLNTKIEKHKTILEDWLHLQTIPVIKGFAPESDHPGGGLNRSICKNIKNFDEIIELNGHIWLSELNQSKIEIILKEDKLYWSDGPAAFQQIMAIHQRWWQSGRAITELNRNPKNDLFLNNMNKIKRLMDKYHNMNSKLAECIEDYTIGEIKI